MTIFSKYLFAEPIWLYGLLVVPILWFLATKQGSKTWLIYPTLRVLGTLGLKPKNQTRQYRLYIFPLLLIPAILGLARPQEQKHRSSRVASGVDILIALDISQSMSIRDFAEPSSRSTIGEQRITAAKKVIKDFIKRRPDDRIGIVSFSGRPYTVAPITLDHHILEYTIDSIILENNQIEGGTAIGTAIVAAGSRLEKLRHYKNTEEEDSKSTPSKSKVIVLVTDGASNTGQLEPLEAARHVATLGIKVYPVAIGTPEGRLGGGASSTQQEFDEQTLQEIAELTQGDYYRAQDYESLREAFSSIDDLEKTEITQNSWLIKKELYPWFIGTSVILLIGFLSYSALNPPPMP